MSNYKEIKEMSNYKESFAWGGHVGWHAKSSNMAALYKMEILKFLNYSSFAKIMTKTKQNLQLD